MTKILPLVRQLQSEAIDPNVPVSKLLRLAKVIATKLDQKDALKWINGELDGYMGADSEEVPEYRMIEGQPKGFNPYRGWQPIEFRDADMERKFSRLPLGQSIGSLEKDLAQRQGGRGQLIFPYRGEAGNRLRKSLHVRVDVAAFLSEGSLWAAIEAVRNLVLNWSLELEKAGVLGEEMDFTAKEKKEAGPVTQQFFIQNVGVFGDVSDGAKVENTQTASVALNIGEVRRFVEQASAAAEQLPKGAKKELEPVLAELRQEVGQAKPEQSKLKSLLTSARTIAEGAAGNLIASGIVTMIAKLLGS